MKASFPGRFARRARRFQPFEPGLDNGSIKADDIVEVLDPESMVPRTKNKVRLETGGEGSLRVRRARLNH
jgi:hypothetical protein